MNNPSNGYRYFDMPIAEVYRSQSNDAVERGEYPTWEERMEGYTPPDDGDYWVEDEYLKNYFAKPVITTPKMERTPDSDIKWRAQDVRAVVDKLTREKNECEKKLEEMKKKKSKKSKPKQKKSKSKPKPKPKPKFGRYGPIIYQDPYNKIYGGKRKKNNISSIYKMGSCSANSDENFASVPMTGGRRRRRRSRRRRPRRTKRRKSKSRKRRRTVRKRRRRRRR